MSFDVELAARAIRTLAAIGADPAARAAFERTYSGPGEAVEVLATFTAVQAADAENRASLRAIAFGRIDSADDETRASQARQDLDLMDAAESTHRAAIVEALTAFEAARALAAAVPTITPGTPAAGAGAGTGTRIATAGASSTDPLTAEPPRRRMKPLVLAAVSFAAGLALASAIAVATTITMNSTAAGDSSAPGDTSSPRTTALREDPAGAARGLLDRGHASTTGSVDAAESLFSRPATARDRVTGFMPVDVDPTSTRRLFGAGSTVIYAARNTADEYCLLVLRGDITTSRCTDTAGFARSGLYTGGASENGTSDASFAVRWDGTIVEILSAG